MADGSADEANLEPDELAPPPDQASTRAIVGILGASTDPGSIQIYLDISFERSYVVAREAVLRRERLEADKSPLGVDCSIVWVRAGTHLRLQMNKTRTLEDEFLAGDFTSRQSFLPQEFLAGPDWIVRGAIERTNNPAFPSCGWKCPSDTGGCTTTVAACDPRPRWTNEPSCWGVC